METSRRKYFDEQDGWRALPGFTVQKILFDREIPRDAFAATGVRVEAFAAPARTAIRVLRFDNFVVARVATRELSTVWDRVRLTARRRFMFLLLEHGTLRVRDDVFSAADGGVLAVVSPGVGRVPLEAVSECSGVIFSFDAREAPDSDIVSRVSVRFRDSPVFGSVYVALRELVESVSPDQQESAEAMRVLLRSFAGSLLHASSEKADESNSDLYREFSRLVDLRFGSATFGVLAALKELGVSRRVLERAAASHGTTAAATIRRRRAAHAIHLLETKPHMSLIAVSKESGFGSLTALRAATAAFYNTTPARARGPVSH
ncbi:helix-turn-helix domain-containing protein [Pseudoclavibacter sp. VKM Ac-2867]|uniref:helix-turn-helix domain-containing protein n=1 Tax=Pseudoclavibacter sp. VKM Ac-2867 TaxID=2783829 RepID=UPI00188C3AB6|nr:helix-turn-helix domain-containing protein [Pseudoclavibacter sp. VKM Ac-2867]MBF4457637.1 helix-turn-helix domain-containing protein [Pseudoclavibacter sp. VKM Ac-2867]